MKIAEMKVHTPDKNNYAFVELITDEGTAGWGASYSTKGQVLGAFEWLKKFVIGENPLEIERVTEKLHQITFWVGRGGAITHAISAINIALWDVAGQNPRPARLRHAGWPTSQVGSRIWVSLVSSVGRSPATNRADEGAGVSRHEARVGALRAAKPGRG